MTALYILGGILFLLILLLFVRIHLHSEYKGIVLTIWVRFLPFKVIIFPGKGKITNVKVEVKKKQGEGPSLYGSLESFKALIAPGLEILKKFGGYLRCDQIRIEYTAAGNDAMGTALQYGGAYAAVSLLYTALSTVLDVREKTLLVNADFLGGSPKFYFSAEVSMEVWKLLRIGLMVLRMRKSARQNKQTT
jgi:hypothetical protein